jgi:predicted nucleotidyltransferase
MKPHDLPLEEIREFCERWQITEFAVFGSILRDDYREDSDLDVLITFVSNAAWGLLDHVQMQLELQTLVGKDVDLLTRPALESSHNWIRKEEILGSAQVLYMRDEAMDVSG